MNLLAPLNTSSYGLTSLNILRALIHECVDVAWFPIGGSDIADPNDLRLAAAARKRAESFDYDAPSLRIWHQFNLAEHVGRGPKCAMPIFELNRFRPDEIHHLCHQDFLFVNSKWAKQVCIDNGVPGERIHVAPLAIDANIFHPNVEPADSPFSANTTVFANAGKWEVRKGHDVLQRAFNAAFTQSDDVALLLHCRNLMGRTEEEVQSLNDHWNRYYQMSPLGRAGKIFINDRRFRSQHELAALLQLADCGVFPARAEGWNLELHEMLAMGKHVIATNYSAHTEFCNQQNASLISINRTEPAHDGVYFFSDDERWDGNPGEWAEFDDDAFEQLVEAMRSVHKLKQEHGTLYNAEGVKDGRKFTWNRTVLKILSALN